MAINPNRWTVKTQEAVQSALELAPPATTPRSPPTTSCSPCSARRTAWSCPSSSGRASPPSPSATRPATAWPRSPRPTARPSPSWAATCGPSSTPPTGSAPTSTTSTCPPSTSSSPWRRPWKLLGGWRGRTCSPSSRTSGAATGSPARTRRTPTRPSSATAATSPRAPATASSTPSSAGTRRSAGSSRSSPAAPRTTPCSSASRAWARPPSSRAWPAASWRATSPRA